MVSIKGKMPATLKGPILDFTLGSINTFGLPDNNFIFRHLAFLLTTDRTPLEIPTGHQTTPE